MKKKIIEVNNLVKKYNKSNKLALNGINKIQQAIAIIINNIFDNLRFEFYSLHDISNRQKIIWCCSSYIIRDSW